jgi:AraC-like DNA-binding protein
MDAVEDYARRWIKREVDQDPELESLSDWVRTIRSLVQGRIFKRVFNLSFGRVVYRVEKSNVLMEDT